MFTIHFRVEDMSVGSFDCLSKVKLAQESDSSYSAQNTVGDADHDVLIWCYVVFRLSLMA